MVDPNSFTFESTFLNASREAVFSSPLERTLAVIANAKSFSSLLASSESGECVMGVFPETRRGGSYTFCWCLRVNRSESKWVRNHRVAYEQQKNEEDVSATSNSNADNGYERGSLMDGRTRDENETGWIDLLNVTFSISRPNVASVVGRP